MKKMMKSKGMKRGGRMKAKGMAKGGMRGGRKMMMMNSVFHVSKTPAQWKIVMKNLRSQLNIA